MIMTVRLECPDDRFAEILQLIRTFEQSDPGRIHLQVYASSDLDSDALAAALGNLQPPMPTVVVLPRRPE